MQLTKTGVTAPSLKYNDDLDFDQAPTESGLALVKDWFYPHHARQDPYSPSPVDLRPAAVRKVKSWLRDNPHLAHGVFATGTLMEALLHDCQLNRRHYISDEAMCSIYAMAFIKFVNGFVDRDVSKIVLESMAVDSKPEMDEMDVEDGSGTPKAAVKGGGESSMYANAARIGMPEKFVDLRHQLVHDGEFPGCWLLKDMTEEALEWLWAKWWVRNATGDPTKARQEVDKWGKIAVENRTRFEDDGVKLDPKQFVPGYGKF